MEEGDLKKVYQMSRGGSKRSHLGPSENQAITTQTEVTNQCL